jgi:Tfp pilus assembly protein PilO
MNFNFIQKLTIKNKLLIVAVLLIFLTVGIGYFVILPLASDIKDVKNDIEARRAKVERKYQQRKQMGDVAEKLEKIKSQSEVLNKPFALNTENLEFITKLEEAASGSGAQQDMNILIEEQTPKSFYNIIPIEIKTLGDIQSQMEYLVKLESLNEYINIDYLAINSASGQDNQDGDSRKVNMLIHARTYWADK